MLCTVIWDVYRDSERTDVWQAISRLIPEDSPDWSPKGIYAYWDPDTRELFYVGLARNLLERFAQHNRLIPNSGGNKADKIDEWFATHERLGLTLLMQGAAVELLNDLYLISPLLGVETGEISRIAEGQLIELHKQARGRWPAWNRMGGSVKGAEWARPSGRSVIALLSAADENLFVARRTLRQLVPDEQALRLEALVHGARMWALMELHEVNDARDMPAQERVDEIARFLMLREGKLVDDLANVDDLIRAWVARFADAQGMERRSEAAMAGLGEIATESRDPGDRMAAVFIERLLLEGGHDEVAQNATEVLATGYLDQSPRLPQ